MKKIYLLGLPVLALPLLAATPLTKWQVSKPVQIPTPLMLDSTDVKGKTFTRSLLLKGATGMKKSETATSVTADTLRAETLPSGIALQEFSTSMRSPKFAKGSIVVQTPLTAELFIDGKSVASGTNPLKAEVTFAPEQSIDITLRTLTEATDTVAPTIAVTWEPAEEFKEVAVVTDQSSKRRFLLDDTMYGPRVSNGSVSADGRWLLTNYANMVSPTRTLKRSTITDLRTGSSRPVDNLTGMRWMPRSSKLYYTKSGIEGTDLYSLDPATMLTEVIAEDVPEGDLYFNADETKLYYVEREAAEEQKGPVKRVTSPAERIPGSDARYNLHEYDPATGLDRPLTFGRQTIDIADFHPDGRHMLLISMTETPTRRPFADMGLYELDTQTLSLDTIVAPTGFLTMASYSPDGKQIAVTGSPELFGGIGKNCGSHKIANDYDHQLFLLDRETLTPRAVSTDFNPPVEGKPMWSKVDGNIYFVGEEGFDRPLFSFNPKNGEFKHIPMPQGVSVIRNIDMSPTSPRIVYTAQGIDRAGGLYSYDLKTRKAAVIDEPLNDRLAEIEMAKGEPWKFTASDGTEIDGFCFLPPGFDASKKYPLIVYYYGGTLPTQHGISSPYSPQVFSSRDYVVYAVNPSGTTGYGQEFSARHCNAWGKRTAQDIIEGTEQFVKEHPYVNAEKIGCIGASYGGFMTQYLQTLTPMFAAAVSHAGISDVTSYWGEGYWGYSYNGVAAPDSYPWSNPELFTKQGSLFNADKINTPLLLLHGTADTNVPIGESIQLYNALKILGKPVELVTVDGENHFISDYPKRKIWQDTIMAWFARYLQDDPSWWENLYPVN